MKLYDARVCIGRDRDLALFQSADVNSVKAMLDKYRIGRAFLVSFASFRLDVVYGNGLVFEAAKQDPRLVPCPTVIPDSAGEVGDEAALIRGFIRKGARCVGFYPKACQVALDGRVIGKLFRALQRHRLPVMIPADQADLLSLAALAARYPRLPFIYVSASYRHRNFFPMLRTAPNLHLTINAPFAPNEGIEEIVRRGGARRLLFASDFPVAEPGAAVSFLMYSRILAAARRAIASGNMERLIRGVRHG